MRQVFSILFILLLLGQSLSHWVTLAAFKINQAWIAKNTCENRFLPQLKCKGNCVLMKKLKQKEEEEKKEPAQLKLEVLSVIVSSRTFYATDPDAVPDNIVTKPLSPRKTGIPIDMSFAFFHPPRGC